MRLFCRAIRKGGDVQTIIFTKMKKFMIAVAFATVLAGSPIYAQTPAEPQTQTTTTVAEDLFKAMANEELPQLIKDVLAQKFEGKTVKAAFVKESAEGKMYKVTLTDAEGTATDIVFDEKGEIVPRK